ncbi:MAG: D-alanyl-D-alanine carboxypeptidase [Pseudomonadota bacterium]
MHAHLLSSRAMLRAAIAVTACLFTFALTGAPAKANPKYAGIVVDVLSGKTLYADNADKRRHPASLTKVMTVYIMFEEIAAGRMKFGTRMRVSKRADGRACSCAGVKAGSTIAARDAIKALVTKSANDVATVVAEHISGTEAAFARRMTKTARRLGMKSTTFKNASGLPNAAQVTTARDMARLGIAIQRDFAQWYGVFQTRSFTFGKKRFRNHNRLLGRVQGVDGIKTGFIRASGFNLITSVRRDKRHVVAVVMGGRTGKRRNAHMTNLIGRYLPKASRGKPSVVMAYSDADAPPMPRANPRPRVLLAAVQPNTQNAGPSAIVSAGQDDPIAGKLMAFAAQARPTADAFEGFDTLRSVIAEASAAGVTAPVRALPSTVELAGATRSLTPPQPRPQDLKTQSDRRIDGAFAALVDTPPQGTLDSDALTRAILRAGAQNTSARLRPPSPREEAQLQSGSAWQIQLGAVDSRSEADALLSDAASEVPEVRSKDRVTVAVATDGGTLYRARFGGFASQRDARAACKRFANHDRPCWAVSM